MGLFLKDIKPYLPVFSRKSRKTTNDQADELNIDSNLSLPIYSLKNKLLQPFKIQIHKIQENIGAFFKCMLRIDVWGRI